MKFRTVELSDPRFEVNGLRFITIKTPHLKGRGDICVFVPEDIPAGQAAPVVILLHGVYGSAWCWAYQAGVHLQAMELIRQKDIPPMILAMPSDGLWGDGSAYLPHHEYHFEKWIASDIPEVLASHIAGAGPASPLFISGLSMGGFGALRIGAKYGKRFAGISAHSSITSLPQMKLFVEEEVSGYNQQDTTDEDVLAAMLRHREYLPPVRFDCGKEDLLIEYNRELHARLKEQDIDHLYEEYPGGHQWPYWEKHIGKSLRFFAGLVNGRQ